MKTLLLRALPAALTILLMPAAASAQNASSIKAPAGFAPIVSPCVKQVDGTCLPVSAANPLPVTGGSGGGGGDASTENQTTQITAEQAIQNQVGAISGSPAANTLQARLATINTTLGTPFQAGGSIGNTTFAATQATASSLNAQVVGAGASGATSIGNPVGIGGVYKTTALTLTDGQRGDLLLGTRQALKIQLTLPDNVNNAGFAGTGTDGFSNSSLNAYQSIVFNNLLGASGWDRARTITAATSAGTGVSAVANTPTTLAAAGVTPASSGSATSVVLKASASNLYSINVANGSTAGFAVVYDATVAPSDGALTASLVRYCVYLNANDVLRDPIGTPITLTNGGVFFVSSTSCTTKTAVAYNFVSAQVP